MVSIEQIKAGVSRYMDREIMPKLQGYKKWIFGAAAAAYISKLESVAGKLRESKWLEPLEIFREDGMIDIDKLYESIRPVASTCDAPIDIPIIGKITLSERDIEEIYRDIINS